MLLPVAILLFSMGLIGFIYARDSLLDQWGEAALLKLERAAHQIDMRLAHPKDWLQMVQETTHLPHGDHFRTTIIQQLEKMEGVVRVRLTGGTGPEMDPAALSEEPNRPEPPVGHDHATNPQVLYHQHKAIRIMPPQYDPQLQKQTVSIVSKVKDEQKRIIDSLEVVLRFDYLMDAVAGMGWWQSDKAFIVADDGRILTGTGRDGRKMLGETGDALEMKTLSAMHGQIRGTVIGKDYPGGEVSGFYRLQEAPWYLVMFAPAQEILAPIIRFRWLYAVTGTAFIFFILLLIRLVTGRTVSAIKKVTQAANKLAKGEDYPPVTAETRDEVGELIRNFNSMALQLEERLRMKHALGLAMDVQQNLLPKSDPHMAGLDIAGTSIYCDETGGDYYDFFQHPGSGHNKISIAVGDVSGHGIPSALLMATVRAILRQRASGHDAPSRIVADVNNQLVKDVEDSGRFVTLFYLEIDINQKKIQYIRAGHDPAILFDPATDTFIELLGKGLPLGAMENAAYEQNSREMRPGQILIIGTDGIWETRNPQGRLFGKTAFLSLIRAAARRSAREIIDVVIQELNDFRCPGEQEDDITLVIVKVEQ